MWVSTKKTFDNSLMFFQFKQKNDFCIFNFTNSKQFFSKIIHKSSLPSIYSKTNKMIEVEIKNVIEFLENIDDKNNIKYDFVKEKFKIEAIIVIELTEGFPPFILEFELELKDFYSNFTFPLLKLIKLFQNNQNNLFSILKKKDLEIAEYILEGGNITHKNIKTETFNEEQFLISTFQDNDSVDNLNLYSSLIEKLNDRCSDVIEELISIPNNVKNNELKKRYTDYHNAQSSTTMDIKNTSIQVKKKKTLLKNL